MKEYRLCFLGFGNVGRALARLFVAKTSELRELGVAWRITGVATRRRGWLVNDRGFEVPAVLGDEIVESGVTGLNEWLERARPDVLFETTSLNP